MTTSPLAGAGPRRGRVFLAVAATALLLGAVTAPGPAAGASGAPPTSDPATSAGHGAAWLVAAIAGGLPLQNFGAPDWGATVDAGLALAWAGVAGDTADAVLAAVTADRETVVAPGGADNPGRLAKVVLLEVLRGGDPRAVGAAPGADLVARLLATVRTSGPDTGLVGGTDPTYDGAVRQALSVFALRAAGEAVPATMTDWLAAQQCADGSWMAYRPDVAAPCARDVDAFTGPDTNATAFAAAVLGGAPAADGLAWLTAVRNTDGGWGYFDGDASDPNSTATVLQASVEIPGGTQAAGGASATLMAWQLGCGAAVVDRGGFSGPFSGGAADLLATVQAVPALAGSGFVAVADPTAGPAVAPDCPPATTTSTTTTSTTTTSTTSTTTTSTTSTTTTSTTSTTVTPTTSTPSSTPTSVTAGVVSGGGGTAVGPPAVVAGTSVTASGGVAATRTTTGLAFTGAGSAGPLLVGLLLLGIGSGLLARRRRWA